MVDFRWICKITDFALRKSLAISYDSKDFAGNRPAHKLLWTAPELLNSSDAYYRTQAGDVYSFGVILQEIALQDEPYAVERDSLDPEEIIERLTNGDQSVKPCIPDSKYENSLALLYNCMFMKLTENFVYQGDQNNIPL